jgi:hypothetical protein
MAADLRASFSALSATSRPKPISARLIALSRTIAA